MACLPGQESPTLQSKKGNHTSKERKSCANNIEIPVSQSARCLGAWWSTFFSSKTWIENNIKKARGAFFARGNGIFHGSLNSLSSWEVLITECCVFPVLLWYWILDCQLNSFDKKISSANIIVHSAPQWPSMRACTLCQVGISTEDCQRCWLHVLTVNDVEFSLSSNANIPVQREQKVTICVWIYSSLTDDWCCDQYRYMGKSGSLSASKKELQVRKSFFHIDTPKVPSSNFMKHAYQPLTPSNTSTVLIHYIGDEK